MTTAESLSEAIENLSQKRYVITDKALKAKENLDNLTAVDPHIETEMNDELVSSDNLKLSKKQRMIYEEYNSNIKLLIALFQKTNLDDLIWFLARPGYIFIINFVIGIIRGIGFMVGVLTVLLLLVKWAQPILPNLVDLSSILSLISILKP